MKVLTTALSLVLTVGVMGDIPWIASVNPILGPDDDTDPTETSFTTPLHGNSLQAADGYFVQLIYAGPDGFIDPIPATVAAGFEQGTAVQGDDVVMSVRWVGALVFAGTDGRFSSPNAVNNEPDGNYYVRAWVGPSQDPAKVQPAGPDKTARIPAPQQSGDTQFWWYGDSATVAYTETPGVPSNTPIDFTATNSFLVSTLVTVEPLPIPEIVELQIADPNVTLTWSSTSAVDYDIESTTDLADTNSWSALVQDVPSMGTNTTRTINNVAGAERYFRIIPAP